MGFFDMIIIMQCLQYLVSLAYNNDYDKLTVTRDTLASVLAQVKDLSKSVAIRLRRDHDLNIQSFKEFYEAANYTWNKEFGELLTPLLGKYKPDFYKLVPQHSNLLESTHNLFIKVGA